MKTAPHRIPTSAPRRKSKIIIPEHVGPHIKLAFSEMKRQCLVYEEVAAGSGINVPTIKAWRHKNVPGLNTLEPVLNHLGWDFIPVPRDEVITPEVRRALAPAAEAMGLTMGESLRFLTIIATGAERREAEEAVVA